MGLEPKKKVLQLESMDNELRQELYNTLIEHEDGTYSKNTLSSDELRLLYKTLWSHYLHFDVEEFSFHPHSKSKNIIKEHYFQASWNKAYDYIEGYINYLVRLNKWRHNDLVNSLNIDLKKHNSAYRIIEGKFAPITNKQELAEISEAANTGQSAIDNHIKKAIALFSDKENRDYANVIKEAISTVEAAAKLVLKTDKATLGQALNELDRSGMIQPQFKSALNSLYAYTNNPDVGARHSAKSDARFKPDFAEAKFVLVTCSAIVNYLLQKFDTHSKDVV
jgi:hypothetical protein